MTHEVVARKPAVWLVGDVDDREFVDAVNTLQATASIGPGKPELIVIAQNRPGSIRQSELTCLRRSAPLAGVVSLLGSWCEGETRTGRPLAETTRLYWYEFPSWWRRQLRLRETGMCPEWLDHLHHRRRPARGNLQGARVAIEATTFDSALAIGDAILTANGKSTWRRCNQPSEDENRVDAGVWIGGQLDDAESRRLARFSDELMQLGAPLVVLLDFPRRDRCEIARHLGVAAVLGVPWRNDDLVDELQQAIYDAKSLRVVPVTRAA